MWKEAEMIQDIGAYTPAHETVIETKPILMTPCFLSKQNKTKKIE